MDYGFDAADSHRSMQTDTCHGNCGSECPICAGKVEVNFRPRDIRGDFFGIADPKLEGAPAEGDSRFVRNADSSGIRL